MAVSFVAAGTIAYQGTTSPANVTAPACDVGDLLVMFVGQKPSTANSGSITTPSGWTLVGNLNGAGGYGTTLGADTGNTNLYIFARVAQAGDSGAAFSVAHSTNNVLWAQIQAFRSATGAWDEPHGFASGSDTSSGNVSATLSANPGITTGDMLAWAMCIPTDVTTPSQFSAHTCTATGATISSVTETSEPDSSTNNDIGGFTARASCTAGTATAAPVVGATAGGTTTNVRGPICMIRMREGAMATINGSMDATESSTPDTLTGSGDVDIAGSMSVTESATADTFAASGTVTDPVITGSMAATESATPDTLAATGTVRVSGGMAATESATPDTLASTGTVRVSGSAAATEAATPDVLAATGGPRVTGSMAVTDPATADTLASYGDVDITGSMAVTDPAAVDTLTASGTVTDPWITGSMAATETGADILAAIGQVRVQGSAAATDSGADTASSTGQVKVSGVASATESGLDALSGSGTVRVTGYLTAADSGDDLLASSGLVRVSGAMVVTEDSAPDILYAWSQKQAQVELLLSLVSEAEAAGFKEATAWFLADAVSLISGSGTFGALGSAAILLSDLVEIEAATGKFVDTEILQHAQVHINFYSFIEGLEKFAVYQDVRRRAVDLDCVIKRKIQ